MSGEYEADLDLALGIRMTVSFTTDRRRVVDYAVVLTIALEGEILTVRVYDAAHGRNELHRFTRSAGKQPAEAFHAGTLGEGLRAAITECRANYENMVEAWIR